MVEQSSRSSQSGGVAVAEDTGKTPQPWQRAAESLSQPVYTPPAAKETGWNKVKQFRVEFGPGRKDILNFTNQLAVMIRAGISLQDSLESISTQQPNQKFKTIIMDLKNKIEAGQSFSQALAEHPQVFSNLYINMVAAAEVSGAIDELEVMEVIAGDPSVLAKPVELVMGPKLPTIGIGQKVQRAVKMLETAPALLVLSGGRPLAVITRTDILAYFETVADVPAGADDG